VMIEGTSFNFGKGRGGNIQRLRQWSAATEIELQVVEPVRTTLLDLSVVDVSSSLIRWLLANGRVRDAAICLGRAYAIRGEVVKGFSRGKQLGVPTAILKCEDQLIPGDGVYAGRCAIGGVAGTTFPAAVSIGSLPTFEQRRFQVEAHLIGFDADLYGQTIAVELIDWVREQRKFDGIAALKRQIERDIEYVRDRMNLPESRAIAAA